MDITPLREHALLLKIKVYQVQVKLVDDFYKIKQVESILQEISVIMTNFRKRAQEIAEVIQVQLTWLETNEELRENAPQKSIENLHIQHELMDFNSKATAKLTDTVGKTFDRCMDFYKRVLTTHNRF